MLHRILFIVKKTLRIKTGRFNATLENMGWSWSRIGVVSVLSIVIVVLGIDIYNSINDALKNYKLLAIEQQKLDETKNAGKQLDAELNYYSSLEYKQRYAYDSLNLGRNKEELYLVQPEGRADYDLENENSDPVIKNDPGLWWQVFFSEAKRQAGL